jgi:hypothetical protein
VAAKRQRISACALDPARVDGCSSWPNRTAALRLGCVRSKGVRCSVHAGAFPGFPKRRDSDDDFATEIGVVGRVSHVMESEEPLMEPLRLCPGRHFATCQAPASCADREFANVFSTCLLQDVHELVPACSAHSACFVFWRPTISLVDHFDFGRPRLPLSFFTMNYFLPLLTTWDDHFQWTNSRAKSNPSSAPSLVDRVLDRSMPNDPVANYNGYFMLYLGGMHASCFEPETATRLFF